MTLLSLIDRNITHVGDAVAYRYLDFTTSERGSAVEYTWAQLGRRLAAIAARLQRLTSRGERVAILAPQGLDYVAAFFATVKAGNIAVPLFAPELPGHAERLDTALRDATPTVVLTTTAAAAAVQAFLAGRPDQPHVVSVDTIDDAEESTSRTSRSTSTTSRTCSTPPAPPVRRWEWRSPTGRWAPT